MPCESKHQQPIERALPCLVTVDALSSTAGNVKAGLIGDEDPDERDLPPKPRGMWWATLMLPRRRLRLFAGWLSPDC
jgi:hypothetical protein